MKKYNLFKYLLHPDAVPPRKIPKEINNCEREVCNEQWLVYELTAAREVQNGAPTNNGASSQSGLALKCLRKYKRFH